LWWRLQWFMQGVLRNSLQYQLHRMHQLYRVYRLYQLLRYLSRWMQGVQRLY
jgi:hypothetical protein